ncbi:MAG: hypothetical protein JO069_16480 [Verrucomicrobia bacterium]|nr:hypothetical protein [Verrucomicrobiota bacterium]
MAMAEAERSIGWAGVFSVWCSVLMGCAHSSQVATVGFPGAHQDRFPARAGTYDIREEVDDSPDFYHGNFEPIRDPLTPGRY